MTKDKRRKFTAEFKAQVVLEVISGAKGFTEGCRQYQVSDQTLSLCWLLGPSVQKSEIFGGTVSLFNQTPL